MDKINMFTATATAMDSRGHAWVADLTTRRVARFQ